MDERDAAAAAACLGLAPPRRSPVGYDDDWADLYDRADDAERDLGAIAFAVSALPKYSGLLGRQVVVLRGARPPVVVRGDGTGASPVPPADPWETFPIPEDLRVPAKRIDGAGRHRGGSDAFVGGFVAGMCAGRPVEECCRAGFFAARTVLTRRQGKLPSRWPKEDEDVLSAVWLNVPEPEPAAAEGEGGPPGSPGSPHK